jgi:hypothetical protein
VEEGGGVDDGGAECIEVRLLGPSPPEAGARLGDVPKRREVVAGQRYPRRPVVDQTQEAEELRLGGGGLQLRQRVEALRVGEHGVGGDEETQVVQEAGANLALGCVRPQTEVEAPLKNATKSAVERLEGGGDDSEIVDVGTGARDVPKGSSHLPLKKHGGATCPERHAVKLEMTAVGGEGEEGRRCWLHADLVEARLEVEGGEEVRTGCKMGELLDAGHGEALDPRVCVQEREVNTEAVPPSALRHHHHRCCPGGAGW